jgi:branched-chain amino acid transport system substrate-binding protein
MVRVIGLALAAGITSIAIAGVAQAQDVSFGFLGGITGPIESLAPPIVDGARLAAQHVNEQGGVLDGRNIRLVIGDTTCADATKAADAADRQVNVENVAAIVGALCSGATISAANNAAIPGGVAMISPASTSPAITTMEDNDLVYRTAVSDAYQGEVLARLIEGAGAETVAMTYVNNDYGKPLAESISAAFSAIGGNVAISVAHEDGKADYRSELGQLAATGATDLVIIGYADGSGGTILRQALESGDFERFFSADGMVSDDIAEQLGSQLEGKLVMTKPGTPEIPGATTFKKLAMDAGIKADGVFVPNAYDATFILALAVEQAGSTDRAAIAQAVRDVATPPGETILPGEWEKAKAAIGDGRGVNYEGATGSVDFDEAGDVVSVFLRAEIENGEVVEKGIAE